MGNQVRIGVRIARTADASALAAFFIQAWKEAGPGSLGFTGATYEEVKDVASIEFLTKRLASPKVRFVVGESEDRVLGFASLRDEGKAEGELSGIVVLQSASGMGLGTKLLHKSFAVAASLGIRVLTVKTETFNQRAIGFYKKNGFVETKKSVQKVGKTRVPVLMLEKKLR